MLAAAMVVMGLGVSCDKDKIQKDDTKPSSGESTVTSLSGTMKTKGKLANDVEQDLTGTVSGSNMNVVFSKSGNYVFSKK